MGYEMANLQQKQVLNIVTMAVDSGAWGFFFIDGPEGTGKTFVKNLLLSYVHSAGGIALPSPHLRFHLSSLIVEERHIHDSKFSLTSNKCHEWEQWSISGAFLEQFWRAWRFLRVRLGLG